MRYAAKGRKGDLPRLAPPSDVPVYHEATVDVVSRFLGGTDDGLFIEERPAVIQIGNYLRAYDVRRLTEQAEADIDRFDAAIRVLQRDRREYIEASFMTWPVVNKPEQCVRVVKGRTRAEVERVIKGQAKATEN